MSNSPASDSQYSLRAALLARLPAAKRRELLARGHLPARFLRVPRTPSANRTVISDPHRREEFDSPDTELDIGPLCASFSDPAAAEDLTFFSGYYTTESRESRGSAKTCVINVKKEAENKAGICSIGTGDQPANPVMRTEVFPTISLEANIQIRLQDCPGRNLGIPGSAKTLTSCSPWKQPQKFQPQREKSRNAVRRFMLDTEQREAKGLSEQAQGLRDRLAVFASLKQKVCYMQCDTSRMQRRESCGKQNWKRKWHGGERTDG